MQNGVAGKLLNGQGGGKGGMRVGRPVIAVPYGASSVAIDRARAPSRPPHSIKCRLRSINFGPQGTKKLSPVAVRLSSWPAHLTGMQQVEGAAVPVAASTALPTSTGGKYQVPGIWGDKIFVPRSFLVGAVIEWRSPSPSFVAPANSCSLPLLLSPSSPRAR